MFLFIKTLEYLSFVYVCLKIQLELSLEFILRESFVILSFKFVKYAGSCKFA